MGNPIEIIAGSGMWLIEANYGFQMYHKYLLRSKEGNLKARDLVENRQEQMNQYFVGLNSGRTVYNPDILKEPAIGFVRYQGVMFAEDTDCKYGMGRFCDIMRRMYSNPNIEGVIVEAHCGGGEVTAALMMMNVIQERNKPVIVHGHYMASGMVLGSAYADLIILSHSMVQFGSIGVMMDLPKKWIKRYMKDWLPLYSAKSKGKNEKLREYMDQGTTTLFEEGLLKTDEQFMGEMRKARGIKKNSPLMSGKMFEARDAINMGGADAIGNLNFCRRRMASLIKAA